MKTRKVKVDSEDGPRQFELLLWGALAPKFVQALRAASLPSGVRVSSGSLGSVLYLPLATPQKWVEGLFGRIERALTEGALCVGVVPDQPLDAAALREAWASELRTRFVRRRLAVAEPTEASSGGAQYESALEAIGEVLSD
jgi:hypothetical protein